MIRPVSKLRAVAPLGPKRSESLRSVLNAHFVGAGLMHPRRRETVVDVVLASKGHETVEELLGHLTGLGIEVSQTALSSAMEVRDEFARDTARRVCAIQARAMCSAANEPASYARLVCDRCGVVEEFSDAERDEVVEVLATIAELHGVALEAQVFELHGRCSRCCATPGVSSEAPDAA